MTRQSRLMACSSCSVADRSSNSLSRSSTPDPTKSIKMAVYFVVNLIMKINTQLGRSTSDDKIGSEQLIARILQANTTGNLPALGIYPRSDRVSTGRLRLSRMYAEG